MVGLQCNEVQRLHYLPTLHQFKYEVEDGYRTDEDAAVRIGHNDAVFPDYSWRGYATFSQLQDQVLLDIPVTTTSDYNVILRYSNPNGQPVEGEVTLTRSKGLSRNDVTFLGGEGGQPKSDEK